MFRAIHALAEADYVSAAFRFLRPVPTTMALPRLWRARRTKGSLKIKYGLVAKGVVLGIFAVYVLLLEFVWNVGVLVGQPVTESPEQQNGIDSVVSPRLLTNTSTSNSSIAITPASKECDFADMSEGTYPNHLLTCEEMKLGGVILPILGCAFMFMGLAIVCDDFFVPALETISWRLDLTDDVAGATFMAAGGSAPELFTSFIGVFISNSNVGFGTIVGSAVFNVLFVIGMCALLSRNPKNPEDNTLTLTAWPLFRDSLYYSFTLLVLVIAFVDNSIAWYESLIMFVTYIGYIAIMFHNEQAAAWCIYKLPSILWGTAPAELRTLVLEAAAKKGDTAWINKYGPQETPESPTASSEELVADKKSPLAVNESVEDVVAVSDDNPPAASNAADSPNDTANTPALVAQSSFSKNSARVLPIGAEADSKEAAPVSASAGSQSASTSIPLPSTEDYAATQEEEDAVPEGLPSGFWDKPTMFESDDDDDDEPTGAGAEGAVAPMADAERIPTTQEKISLQARTIYHYMSYPLKVALWYTIPNPKPFSDKELLKPLLHRKVRPDFIVTFFLSIMWIGFFSYWMVWWAESIGFVLGIPSEVMGLTFLAAGTSVPDLLSSIAVARKGLGDMAVSSSIGSNIFDVTIGLPIPWLLWSLARGGLAKEVIADGLFTSVIVLFMMLVAVVVTVIYYKWKMTKALGGAMFVLYAVFVLQNLLTEYGYLPNIR